MWNNANEFFFFFSSRRRHTRCSRDWSSDVCSSDLLLCMMRPARTIAPPKAAPIAWCPRQTPRMGTRPAKRSMSGTETPASRGVHGPVGAERRHLLQRDGVVAPHVDLGAELAQVLDQVVGEGVVVVDHEEPRRSHHRASARRTAWSMARDLLTHSRCSASGLESATMPAPAWMYTRPP